MWGLRENCSDLCAAQVFFIGDLAFSVLWVALALFEFVVAVALGGSHVIGGGLSMHWVHILETLLGEFP